MASREAGLLQTLAELETGGGRDAPGKRPTLLPPSKGEPPAGTQDSLPKRPARPEDVVRLNLVGAVLTDAGLKELAVLKNLQSLDLRGTGIKLTGAGMKELAGLKRLNLLVLDENQITDETLRGLREVGMLQTLSKATTNPETNKRPARPEDVLRLFLGMTQVTDAGLKELAGLKNLQFLGLDNTKVTDAGLKELAGFQNLEWLDLRATQVTDAGLKELAGLKKLHNLQLVGSRVTEAGLRERAGLKTNAAPVIKGEHLLVTAPGSGTPSAYQIFRINADGPGRRPTDRRRGGRD